MGGCKFRILRSSGGGNFCLAGFLSELFGFGLGFGIIGGIFVQIGEDGLHGGIALGELAFFAVGGG